MNAVSSIKRRSKAFSTRYQAALNHYLKRGSAANRAVALRLGRQALSMGLETLDLALIHEQALIVRALPLEPPAARDLIIRQAGVFFAQAIIPMEETHRSALEANIRLSRLNQALSRRTLTLAASGRQLKKEIARRLVVENTLRKSRRHTGLLLEQSQQLQEQMRQLSRRILSVQEEERKRISRELHDVISQMLTGINVRLAALKLEAAANTKGLGKKIALTQRLVEKSVDIVHRFARELRPTMLDDLGLIPTLHSFMKRFTLETGIRTSLTAFAELESLNSSQRTTLYRVAQEALNNVSRHAHASRVTVSFRHLPGCVRMKIKDDGRSFDVGHNLLTQGSKRLGLLGMRERVEMIDGTFIIESARGRGTTITAEIPLSRNTRKQARP